MKKKQLAQFFKHLLYFLAMGSIVHNGHGASIDRKAYGFIEPIKFNPIAGSNEDYEISGWACFEKLDTPVTLHVYGHQFIFGVVADHGSESAINNVCKSRGKRHRFARRMNRKMAEDLYVAVLNKTVRPWIVARGFKNKLAQVAPDFISKSLANVARPVALSRLVKNSHAPLTIHSGTNIIIDKSLDMGFVILEGRLSCKDAGADASAVKFKIKGLLIRGDQGVFTCGTKEKPHLGKLDIILKKGYSHTFMKGRHATGERSMVAIDGGILRLHGREGKAGWQYLNGSVKIGARKILVGGGLTKWEKNDLLLLGPTGYRHQESEIFTLLKSPKTSGYLQLDRPVKYHHFGKLMKYRGIVVDQRAEVANLSRNIKIYPASPSNSIGGHIMVTMGGQAFVQNVELIQMGQMGEMGRYPFHWHKRGNVAGQYIKDSVIRDSYQRCITVHGTDYATVSGNVCYNHFGHGIFLEDGNEENNIIENNLVMKSKRVPAHRALLFSDFKDIDPVRFSAVSSFWISNPKNKVTGNRAAGSEGTGFWMSFNQELYCQKGQGEGHGFCRVPREGVEQANYFPARQVTLAFNNNTAHSSLVGMTWDGAPMGPKTNNPLNPEDRVVQASHYLSGWAYPGYVPVFKNLQVYKNQLTGIYYRGDEAVFENALFADNRNSFFMAYNQSVNNSLIIGFSENHSEHELKGMFSTHGTKSLIRGIMLYDGPLMLNNVHFQGFPSQQVFLHGTEVTPTPFTLLGGSQKFVGTSRGLSFSPTPYRKILMNDRLSKTFITTMISSGHKDLDGSLSGYPGHTIVANIPFMKVGGEQICKVLHSEAQACHYNFGTYTLSTPFNLPTTSSILFDTKRFKTDLDGKTLPHTIVPFIPNRPREQYTHNRLMGMVRGFDEVYELTNFHPDAFSYRVHLTYSEAQNNKMSAVLKVQTHKKCKLVHPYRPDLNPVAVNSLRALRAEKSRGAYFFQDGFLWVKLKTTHMVNTAIPHYESEDLEISCP